MEITRSNDHNNLITDMENLSHFPCTATHIVHMWTEWGQDVCGEEQPPDPAITSRILRLCEKLGRRPLFNKITEANVLHMHCQTLLVANTVHFEPTSLSFHAVARTQRVEPLPPVVAQVLDLARRGLDALSQVELQKSTIGNAFKTAVFRALFVQCTHPHSSVVLFDEALELGEYLTSPAYTGPDVLKRLIRGKCAYLCWGRSSRRTETAVDDLNNAIKWAEGETNASPAQRCGSLGIYYAERADLLERDVDRRADLIKAVRLTREALRLTDSGDDRRHCEWNLGRRLLSLYEETLREQDIDDAIDLLKCAQEGTADQDPDTSEFKRGYFRALAVKGRVTNDAKLQEKAVVGLVDLLKTIPDNEPQRKITILTDLTCSEFVLERRKFDRNRMDELYPQLSTEVKDQLRFATYTEDLPAIFRWNLNHRGVESVETPLLRSLRYDGQSIPAITSGQLYRPAGEQYTSLLWSLGGRAGRDRSQRLRILGLKQSSYRKYRLAEFLLRKAIQGTEGDPTNHARCLETIALYCCERLDDLPTVKDVPDNLLVHDTTATVERQKVVLAGLASVHLILRAAFASLHVAQYEPAPPDLRVYYGRRAGKIFARLNIWHHASISYHTASTALQGSLSLAATLPDLVKFAKQGLDISQKGSFAAVKDQMQPSEVLVRIEASRALAISTLMINHPDLTALQSGLPDKYREYDDLRKQLRNAIDNVKRHDLPDFGKAKPIHLKKVSGCDASQIDEPTHSEDVFAIWNQLRYLEARIRKHDNFDRFQLPATPEEMSLLAGTGAIVCFNVIDQGTHAFTVTRKSGVRIVELPHLTSEAIVKHALDSASDLRLSSRPMEERPQANKDLAKLLRWLWDTVVDPVLEHLGYKHQGKLESPPELPRIHWVSSGIMGALPLHAAGVYTKAGHGKERTSMYALSSYTPSITALAASRRKKIKPFNSLNDKMLIVGMQTTPGLCDLPKVKEEILGIVHAFCDPCDDGLTMRKVISFEPLISDLFPGPMGTDPTPEKVLAELPTTDAVHFACHGISCPVDPSSSALVVGKYERFYTGAFPRLLTVDQISNLDLERPRLAYLSACVTATTSDPLAFDEALHVASMLQVAGFPHVIGTMWEVKDTVSASMAGKFYTWLRTLMAENDADSDNHEAVAMALHMASEEIREQNPAAYLDWVPYVHYGA